LTEGRFDVDEGVQESVDVHAWHSSPLKVSPPLLPQFASFPLDGARAGTSCGIPPVGCNLSFRGHQLAPSDGRCAYLAKDIERHEQGGDALALAIMGYGARAPFFMGRSGWVRSSARIWLFSSTDKTIAWLGDGVRFPYFLREKYRDLAQNRGPAAISFVFSVV